MLHDKYQYMHMYQTHACLHKNLGQELDGAVRDSDSMAPGRWGEEAGLSFWACVNGHTFVVASG